MDNLIKDLKKDLKENYFPSNFVIHSPENCERVKIEVENEFVAQFHKSQQFEEFMQQKSGFLLFLQKNGVEFSIVDKEEEKTRIWMKLGVDVKIAGEQLHKLIVHLFGL